MDMEQLLYSIVGLVARLHNYILGLNNGYENSFTDKELHFIIIGAFGILLLFVLYPLFKYLANTGHIMVVTFLYVFTVMVVIAFAIEIGQGVTHTGAMEFDDIMYGIGGFLAMFAVFAVIRAIFHAIRRWVKRDDSDYYM